ncbi:MAG TPA: 30S ribosomal protein S18 [bacterium]|jgi:small subunit ribosomal protein S18|nr:30S ribosomal protein S18 [bacterium]HRU90233.1 30S ribosomal protein S18 [Patescibacteria group bacterium]HOR69545.1 30S ribosomal protein S18 [bacterium]HOS98924.1 30S ribosomal protein S18 [bacterium]HPL83724.1 30S ribosomal protein S18 [bacterium]
MNHHTPGKPCYFCQNNIKDIDYKDTFLLRRYTNSLGKILPKRRTGTCDKHQRQLALAIKRARIMGLLMFTRQ